MKRIIITFLSLWLALSVGCQSKGTPSELNFDFERVENGMPIGLNISANSDYVTYLDSVNVKSGKYAVVIEYKGETPAFKAVSFTLPKNYGGKQITLSGYIKTENVAGGYAGLWMRIDPEIAFDNMGQRGITGTTDWTKYEITLAMNPTKTKEIVVGGLLTGKGKMWLDNLNVLIDGKPIDEAKLVERVLLPAEKDHAFDGGSTIVFPELTKQRIADLDLLGRVWGFLKYHHPEVGKGNYNWDYELFRMLPGYLNVKNKKQRDKVLLNWISKYGEVPVCTTCKETPADAYLKPDLSWIDNTGMSADLRQKLLFIYANRHQGEHFYIKMAAFVSNPEFTNENAYRDMPYPDAGFRLLSLFRYWNMIKYFFPSTYLTDKDWNTVLNEYIPMFLTAQNGLEYELAALQIIGDIQDTHANLWGGGNKINELRGSLYAPFRVQFVEKKLVVTDYYNPELKEMAGLEIGDVITHINGRRVEAIVDSLRRYYPASNEPVRLRDISADMLRSPHNIISIDYISSGIVQKKLLTLYSRNNLNMYHWYKTDPQAKCYKLLDGNIGYVTLAMIKDKDIPVIKEEFKDTKGIIIDIRNYPSTFVPFLLGSYFLTKPTPFVKFTMGSINNPGMFTFTSELVISKATAPYRGKLVVIVNEISQSQAEYTAMAFKAGENVTVVGSTTAGADGNVSRILLPGGLQTMISGLGVYYPDGGQTQRIGIIPDIRVEPTIDGIKAGRDEVLEKAIGTINRETGSAE